MSDVITRFAPSPTGHLHIGGARTALFCWAYAKRFGGRFVLRIEDTDQRRSSMDAVSGILADLKWLGLTWDDGPEVKDTRGVGPYFQSERGDIYAKYFDQLIAQDKAYYAFDDQATLDAARDAAMAAKTTYRYDRISAHAIDKATRQARVDAGEPHVIRLCIGDDPITVHDEVLGDVTVGPDAIDDFIIRKRDGFPTYHFAVVVDDELMGVTHILRGQEHLNNTPKHRALQMALGFRTPATAHMPLIFNTDGSKMSKRDKDKAARTAAKAAKLSASPVASIDDARFASWLKDKKSQLETAQLMDLASSLDVVLPEIDVDDFRRSGYDPATLCNYLALLGWNPGMKNDDGTDLERFDMAFLAEHFDLNRIGKSNSKFDRDKLRAFNKDTIAQMSDETFLAQWTVWLAEFNPSVLEHMSNEQMALLAHMARPRCSTLADALDPVRFALTDCDAIAYDPKAVKKALHKGEPSGHAALAAFKATLKTIAPFDSETINATVKSYCETNAIGMGKVAQPLRIAATGTSVSPDLGDTLAVLGLDEVVNRVDRCLAHCAPDVTPSEMP